jgi:hypothetical protein
LELDDEEDESSRLSYFNVLIVSINDVKFALYISSVSSPTPPPSIGVDKA